MICYSVYLDKVNIGIIVIDEDYNILIRNSEIERISKLSKSKVLKEKIYEICPVFTEEMYKNVLYTAIFKGQSRFCSSVLHKAFIYPFDEK
ncbi:MAG: hypothetical protein ACYDEJ_05345 [Desulfitobacteriaceae bacterium]